MKIIDLAKGKFIAVKNEVENKHSLLEVGSIEHLYRRQMIHDSDGWETGKSNIITLGYVVHFVNGYKKRYNNLMDINFTEKSIEKSDVNDFNNE